VHYAPGALTSGLSETRAVDADVTLPAARPAAPTAVVLATARAADGRPAALLPFGDGTVIGRLVGQLGPVVVLARPEFEPDVRRAAGAAADVRASVSPAGDLRAIAAVARASGGDLLVLHGDVVTHAEALGWLLAGRRSGALTGGRGRAEFPVQARRDRLTSAASAYHGVGRPNATFLGVLRAAPDDLGTLAQVAERLAELVEDPPDAWLAELARKGERATSDVEDDHADPEGAEEDRPGPADPDDVAALLLVGLVRAGVHVAPVFLRRLEWDRPLSPAGAAAAAERIARSDVDRLRLDSSVKAIDGFFTTFLVSPYSKHLARWAARRGLTPDQVTIASMAIGVLAAAAFATGERWGLIAGAVLLLASFVTDCVDGQLARYTGTFSRLGGWLDAMFDRAKEYLAFAGLAIGAGDVWLLACAAITLQTVRHAADFAFAAAQDEAVRPLPVEEPLDGAARPARILAAWRGFDTWAPLRWGKRMIAFPIGERFAVIALTAALLEPRVTFVVLLAWGGVALAYSQAGRVLRSLR